MKHTILIRSLVAISLVTLTGVALAEGFLLQRMNQRLAGLEERPVLIQSNPAPAGFMNLTPAWLHPVFNPAALNPAALNLAAWDPIGFHSIANLMAEDFYPLGGFLVPVVQAPEFGPRTQVAQDGKAYRVQIQLPGVKPEDIKVRVDGRVLSIDAQSGGTSQARAGQKDEQARYSSSFSESFTLPGAVDAKAMQKHVDNGVLTLILPRSNT